jgi:hypothetical protein
MATVRDSARRRVARRCDPLSTAARRHRRQLRTTARTERSRPKFLVLWLEVQVMHAAGEVLWSFQSALDESLVDDYLGGDVRQLTSLPGLHLLSHGLEVPLHSINANRDAVDERERFRVYLLDPFQNHGLPNAWRLVGQHLPAELYARNPLNVRFFPFLQAVCDPCRGFFFASRPRPGRETPRDAIGGVRVSQFD